FSGLKWAKSRAKKASKRRLICSTVCINACIFSSSETFKCEGSSSPQCALMALPRYKGQGSAAAEPHTVITTCGLNRSQSCMVLLDKPCVEMPKFCKVFRVKG